MRPSHDQPRWRQWVTVRTVPVFVLLGIATLLAIQWAMSSPKQPVVRIEGALAQQISRATTIHDCLNLDNGPAAIICAGHAVGAIVKRLKEQFPSPCVRWELISAWGDMLASTPPEHLVNSEALKAYHEVANWDVLHPFASCPGEQRYGWVGDGGKWTCVPMHKRDTDKAFRNGDCMVYSFGVQDKPSYEHVLVDHLGCTVHAFDPTPGLKSPFTRHTDRITFHPWGILQRDGTLELRGKPVPGYSLPTIMTKLGHTGTTLDVLKVDVEGAEWGILWDIVPLATSEEGLPFHQLQVEFHGNMEKPHVPLWDAVRIIVGLMDGGYLATHKELNGFHPNALTEATFVSLAWLLEHEPACKV